MILGAGTFVSADKQDLRIGGFVGYGVVDGKGQNLIKNANGKLQLENFKDTKQFRIYCKKASQGQSQWNNLEDDQTAWQFPIQEFTVNDTTARSTGFEPTSMLDKFSTTSTLVMACKVQEERAGVGWQDLTSLSGTQNTDNGGPVALSGEWVRVHFQGTCDAGLMDTDTTFSTSITGENYNAGRIYEAPLRLDAKFPCIHPVGFTRDIHLNLQYKATEEARTALIVENDITTKKLTFTAGNRDINSDGTEFVMTLASSPVSFDLGTLKPHPDYYRSGVTACDSVDDESLCKGGLRATLELSSANISYSVPTALVSYTSQATGFKFKPCTDVGQILSNNDVVSAASIFEILEACYGKVVRDKVKSWTSATNSVEKDLRSDIYSLVLESRDDSDDGGKGSLLTDMVCPFTCPDRSTAGCPLTTDNTTDSTSHSAMKCLHVGVKTTSHTPNFWDNRCAARTDGLNNPSDALAAVLNGTQFTENLRDPYNFVYKFTRNGQFVNPDPVEFEAYTANLHVDVTKHDVDMLLQTGESLTEISNNAAFFTVEGNNFVQEVTLNTNEVLGITNVPRYVTSLTLYGQVFLDCTRSKVNLSNAMPINIGTPLKTSGKFQPVGFNKDDLSAHNPCNPLFEYVRDDTNAATGQDVAYDVTAVMYAGAGEPVSITEDPSLVKMCDEAPGTATGTSCARGGFHSSTVKTDHTNPVALLDSLCSVEGFPRKAGVIGALVRFGENREYAPVICPGTCKEATINDVALDWDLDLTVSASDNADKTITTTSDPNKLIVRQSTSDWGDNDTDTQTDPHRYYTLERVAYLTPVSSDDCQADGTLTIDDDSVPTDNNVTTGCLVYKQGRPTLASEDWQAATEYYGIEKAADMVNWFTSCGSQTALGAEVHLVQRFKVTYGDDRDISFCQTKKLSVTVQQVMVGETTQTLTTVQQEDSADDASINAMLEQVQFTKEGCGGDLQRLAATANIVSSVALQANFDATPAFFRDSGKTSWVQNANNVQDGLVTWSTACFDICGGADAQLATMLENHELSVSFSDGSTGGLDINFKIDMEGSPCAATDRVNVATAELTLYNAGKPAEGQTEVTCDATSFGAVAAGKEPRALTDVVCGRLNVTDLGDSSLFIMSTQLTRQLPGSASELLCEAATGETDFNGQSCVGDARNVMFAPSGQTGLTQDSAGTGEFIKFADSSIKLFADDAFATIRYTIYWEQRLGSGNRRLLRSDMIFGEGVSTVKGDLTVLPVSEQIEDAVESLDSEPAGTTDDTDDTEEDEGTSTAMIVGIVVAAAAVVALAGWGYMKSQDKKVKQLKDPENAGYSKVRRSERFSTMNF